MRAVAPSSGGDWLARASIAIIGAIDSCDVAIVTGQSAAQVLAKDTTARGAWLASSADFENGNLG